MTPEPILPDEQRSYRVVVVDDDPGVLEVVTLLLEFRGFEVASAGDGESGLGLARRTDPDLVVTDLDMPRMTGLELGRRLRGDPALADVPIVAMTSRSSLLRDAAEWSGIFSAVLAKPLTVKTFLAVVSRVLQVA